MIVEVLTRKDIVGGLSFCSSSSSEMEYPPEELDNRRNSICEKWVFTRKFMLGSGGQWEVVKWMKKERRSGGEETKI